MLITYHVIHVEIDAWIHRAGTSQNSIQLLCPTSLQLYSFPSTHTPHHTARGSTHYAQKYPYLQQSRQTTARQILPADCKSIPFSPLLNSGSPFFNGIASSLLQDIATQQALVQEIYSLVSKRPDTACNFLEGSKLLGGKDTRVIYRHYATLYFVFVVDESESELGILDLIQVI